MRPVIIAILAVLSGCTSTDQVAQDYCLKHGYVLGTAAYADCHDEMFAIVRQRRIEALSNMADSLNATSASRRASTPPPAFGLPATYPAMPSAPPEGVPPVQWDSGFPRPAPTPSCIGNVQIPTAVWASAPCP
jgi:hypothetical protein